MKTSIYSLCLLLTASILFASCREKENDEPCINNEPYISNSLDGVVINGIRWATRNVDAPGTFAASPQSAGMFFQWNRPIGWAAAGSVTDWNNSEPTGAYWTRDNDPCPVGWRVPTEQEFISLIEATFGLAFESREWEEYWRNLFVNNRTSGNWRTNWRNAGVNGMVLGLAPDLIFLPAVGERRARDGMLDFAGISGNYWVGTLNFGSPMNFGFSRNGAGAGAGWTSAGRSVRCVAENY